MNTRLCPVCDSCQIEEFIRINNLPLLLFPVDENIKNEIATKDMSSYYCIQCGHVFTDRISAEDADLIYGQYYKFYPFEGLESMQAAYRRPFELFFEKTVKTQGLAQKCNKLLEIGCSSGKVLDHFETLGFRSYGIDPSPLNTDKSGKIISGTYENYSFDQPFNVIVSCFSLEHINNLSVFCRKIYADLADGGIVFVQVPNIPFYCKHQIPMFLAHEHIHYFNAYSLELTFSRHGFCPIGISSDNSDSMMIALKKDHKNCSPVIAEKLPSRFYDNYLATKRRQADKISDFLCKQCQLCFYGAGLPMCWLLYEINLQEKYPAGIVIDDNMLLNGKFFPLTDYEVKTFDQTIIKRSNTVLLTLNPTYHPVVVQKIRASGFSGTIYGLDHNGLHEV